jgi:transposase
MGRQARRVDTAAAPQPVHEHILEMTEATMKRVDDLSKSLAPFDAGACLVVVVELSQSSWLVAGRAANLDRQPIKKLEPDEYALLRLLQRWREEASQKGPRIERITLAYEAGRDGFWLARWLIRNGIDVHVMHPSSIAVSREHRRPKTDRLDTSLLMRAFLGWLRGERGHCTMVVVPSLSEEDLKRPSREHETLAGECARTINRLKSALIRLGIKGFNPKLRRAQGRLEALRTPEGESIPPNMLREMNHDLARLAFIRDQMRSTEHARLKRIDDGSSGETSPMVLMLARVIGIGIETADMLVHELLSRNLRDRRAVARFAGLTGSPDESGSRRREKGLSKAGSSRVRRGMVELAWRFLQHQRERALAIWFRKRVETPGARKKKMIVALARKLLIALWRLVHTGEVPQGVALRPAT